MFQRAGGWIDGRAGVLLDHILLPLANLLGGILLALSGMANSANRVSIIGNSWDRGVVLGVAIGILFASVLGGQWRLWQKSGERDKLAVMTGKVTSLEGNLAQARQALDSFLRLYLSELASRLKYYSNERISIFKPACDGQLRLAARFSLANIYQTPGRQSYPSNQGCIGQAWEWGEFSVLDLPDPQKDPVAWRRALLDRCGIPEEVAQGFHMKSRTCIAFRVSHPVKGPLGVIAFESQQAATAAANGAILDPRALKLALKGEQEGKRLEYLLEILSSLEG